MAKLHTIVLHKDEDVTSAIHAYLMDKKWKAGVIVSAVGSIYDVTVGNPGSYEMPPKMLQTTINEPCEIVSFMGEITRKCDAPAGLPCQVTNTPSDYIVHVHRTCSHGENATVTGGGFRKATVLRAVNVYVLEVEDENELC